MVSTPTKFQTSFVPKKPVISNARVYTKKPTNFFGIIATFIFIVAVVASGGVYLYKFSLQNTIENQLADLQRARDEFDPEQVARATRLNDRLISVDTLLDNHRSPSQVFEVLEEFTLGSVRFNSFNYATEDDGEVSISGRGTGVGFESVVLQSDEFGGTNLLRDVVFDSVVGQESGLVTFSFNGILDPTVVLYRKSLSENNIERQDNDVRDSNDSGTTLPDFERVEDNEDDVDSDNSTSTEDSTTNNNDEI